MIKPKGAVTVFIIIIIAVIGWATFITFVITPNFLVGIALSLIGGAVIGVVVSLLMRKWWFARLKGG